ncbi:MAG: hypothetical protein Q6L49_11655, partial [Thermostichales cyanobacterium HHBFW_bins_127]
MTMFRSGSHVGLVALLLLISGGRFLAAQPLPPLPGEPPAPTPEPGTLSLPEEVINQRVTSELLQLCGGPRCPQATVVVRVPLELDETYSQALGKLEQQVVAQVQTSFQQDAN